MANWIHELGLFVFAVLAHWQALATGGLITAAIGVYERHRKQNLSWQSYVFVISVFCLYSVFAAWQDEHHNTGTVASEKSDYASLYNGCTADLKASQGTLRDKEMLATSLQSVFTALQGTQAQQQANIATCINTLAKLNPKVRESIVVSAITFRALDPSGRSHMKGLAEARKDMTYEIMLVVSTNEQEPSFTGTLKCGVPFDITLPPQFMPMTILVKADVKERSPFEYHITLPLGDHEWNANHPIVVGVTSPFENLSFCEFDPD